MRGWLGLLVFVAACGGAAQSDVFGDPPPASPAPTTDPTGTPTAPPTGTTPNPPPPDPVPPCAATTYYRDTDGDGFGGATTQITCKDPGAGWATKGGDCADDDQDVFPGQTLYFGDSYSKGGGA